MNENPYEPPKLEVDSKPFSPLRWLAIIETCLVWPFLVIMFCVSAVIYFFGVIAFASSNEVVGGGIFALLGLALGWLVIAAGMQRARK